MTGGGHFVSPAPTLSRGGEGQGGGRQYGRLLRNKGHHSDDDGYVLSTQHTAS